MGTFSIPFFSVPGMGGDLMGLYQFLVTSHELRVTRRKASPSADMRQAFIKSAIENGVSPVAVAVRPQKQLAEVPG